MFQVGDKVWFINEFGQRIWSTITAVVPKGLYSKNEIAYAVKGSYGSYVRVASELSHLTNVEKKGGSGWQLYRRNPYLRL